MLDIQLFVAGENTNGGHGPLELSLHRGGGEGI